MPRPKRVAAQKALNNTRNQTISNVNKDDNHSDNGTGTNSAKRWSAPLSSEYESSDDSSDSKKGKVIVKRKVTPRKSRTVIGENNNDNGLTATITSDKGSQVSPSLSELEANDLSNEKETQKSPPKRRGRPSKKDKVIVPTTTTRRRKKDSDSNKRYKTLEDFTSLPPIIHGVSFWQNCVKKARPIKRGIRSTGTFSLARPPVDALFINKDDDRSLFRETLVDLSWIEKVQLINNHANDRIIKEKEDTNLIIDLAETRLDVKEGKSSFDASFGWNFINIGAGGVSALDFSLPLQGEEKEQFLACSAYPTSGYKDHWNMAVNDMEGDDCPILVYKITRELSITELMISIEHDHGIVRALYWCPFDSTILMAIFGDGDLCIFSIPSTKSLAKGGSNQLYKIVDSSLTISEIKDEIIITCAAWCPINQEDSSLIIAVGYSSGHVRLWRLKNSLENSLQCISVVRPSHEAITLISFHDQNPLILAVGLHDSQALIIDFTDPTHFIPFQSPVALVSLVHWSQIYKSWISADSEIGIRLLPHVDLMNRSSLPAATFNVPVSSIDTSIMHNVIVSAGTDGTIHYSIIDIEKRNLIFERSLLEINYDQSSNQKTTTMLSIKNSLTVPKLSNQPNSLNSLNRSINFVRWSRSLETPGLLAVGLAFTGLIILIPMDQFLLLEPDRS